jgi:hypothetical protein
MSLFLVFFSGMVAGWRVGVLLCILRGVLEKLGFLGGVFVVDVWWIAWLTWADDTTLRGG